ncbi:hypothetical protein DM02DRAFT_577231 [Periconia macrospinosa]|uniref:P-loop containing nucleoside triphosphate hydrolase protein n=1 Tax=Periconia macrospinosa TaxID=97972 RepID=A0A2V1CZS5_9PLEO|nr:hypothetical protein DM02DRAFT_577231 [Periconia macrospinosa]
MPTPPRPEDPSLQPRSTGKLLILNGFPGTGKLTILRKVKECLPTASTRLLDNHLLIDPVEAVIPGRSDKHHDLRRQVRAPIFSQLRELAQEGHIILMTACLVENNDTDSNFLQEYFDIVRETGVILFWINAHCNLDILEQRVRSPERIQDTKAKLKDPSVIRDLVHAHRLIEPGKSASNLVKLIYEDLDANQSVECSADALMRMIGIPQSGE